MLSDKIRLNAFCHVDANGKWQKMTAKIIGWKRLHQDPNLISVALDDNWILKCITVREHFSAKTWCATEDGRILHYTKQNGLREVAPRYRLKNAKTRYHYTKNGVSGSGRGYLDFKITEHSSISLHIFVYECWYGARTPGMQIDHRNGIELDNRPINLEEVTPEENQYRSIVLNAMRSARKADGTPVYDMAVYEREPFRLVELFDKWRDLYRPKTKNDVLKLAINPSYDTRNHCHGVVIKK